jgi:GntR family transcriptional regulator
MREYQFKPRDQIVEKIECFIIENQLKPGDALPSERQLCEAWGCNRMTYRAACKRLISEGMLESVPYKGYYVADEKLERYLQDLNSFSDFVKQKGYTLTNQLISSNILVPSRRIANELQLSRDETVFELSRVRLVDDTPISIDTVSIPYHRFKGIETYDFEKLSLYSIMENEYNIAPDGGYEEISITYADKNEAEILQIEEGQALFFLRGITLDSQKAPVELIKSVLRPDKIRFAGELQK